MKLTIAELAGILEKKETSFTYTTKKGITKTVYGYIYKPFSNLKGGISNKTGNLVFWDLIKNDWKTIFSGSTIYLVDSLIFDEEEDIEKVIASVNPGNLVSKNVLINLLEKRIVKFEYKTKDNDLREAYGTNDLTRVDIAPLSSSPNDNILYYDVLKDGVRTIYSKNNDLFKVIEVLDLPLKNDKNRKK